MEKVVNFYKSTRLNLLKWSKVHILGLFIFNFILMFLILLHSAGYFAPYFPITINVIVLISLIMAVFLLGIRSKTIFGFALTFWVFTAFLRVLSVNIWAERSAIYVFQALIIGVVLLFFER